MRQNFKSHLSVSRFPLFTLFIIKIKSNFPTGRVEIGIRMD